MTYAPETNPLAVVLDLGTPYSVSTDPLALDFDFLPAGEAQQLLANSLETNSSTSNAVINQTENLSAVSLESYTAVTNDALVEEFTNESNIESVSTTSETVLSQVHSITPNSLVSASSTSSTAVGQTQNLLANSLESSSSVTTALFLVEGENALLANSIQAESTAGTETLAQAHSFSSQGISSNTTVTSSNIHENQKLSANGLKANSSTTSSNITQINKIIPDNLVSGSSTSNTDITQTQSLLSNSLESFATVTNASLVEEGPDAIISEYIESVSTTSETVLSQVHSLSAISLDSDSKLTEPTLMAKDYLLAYGVNSWSKVSIPALVQIQSLQSQIIVCNPVTSNGVLEQIHTLTSGSIEAISTAGIVREIWRVDILVNLNISKKILADFNISKKINRTLYQSRKVSSTLNLD